MNNITKAIIGTTIAVGSLFGTVQSAQASDCVYGDGYSICFDSNGYNNWDLVFENNHTTEVMNVQCDGKLVDTWRSKGGLSQSEAQSVAELFCSA